MNLSPTRGKSSSFDTDKEDNPLIKTLKEVCRALQGFRPAGSSLHLHKCLQREVGQHLLSLEP